MLFRSKYWEETLFPMIKRASDDIYNPDIPPRLLSVTSKEKQALKESIFDNYEIKQINIL